ncbi:MAG: hypothetical protein ACRDOT_00950 [Aeromicrobium sp.]
MRMAAATLVAVALLAGCGGDGEATGPSDVSLAVSKTGSTYKLTAPATAEAGLAEISLEVDTPKTEEHEAQLVRVTGDHTLAEALKVLSSDHLGEQTPSWLFAGGGVGSTKGGTTASVTQILTPGTYHVLDVGEGEGDEVPSFAEQGATATIEVTGKIGDAKLPAADATVTAEEYGFTTEGLVAGVNRTRFDNTGNERHHILAVPFAEGATLEDVKAFATSEGPPDGPPPIDFSQAVVTAVLEGGDSQIVELKLTSGKYAFVCFQSDRDGGPPHAAMDMIDEVEIK